MTFGEMQVELRKRGRAGEYAAQLAESLVAVDFELGGVGEAYVWRANFADDVSLFLARLRGERCDSHIWSTPPRPYVSSDFEVGRLALIHVLAHVRYTCALVLHDVPEGAP